MKKLLMFGAVSCIVLATGGHAIGGAEIDISGQVRVRHETVQKEFDDDAAFRDHTDLRTRIKIKAAIAGNTQVVIQFQDSRRFGAMTAFDAPASGELNDGKNVDVHQAYLQVDKLWVNGPGIKAGRFEFNTGNQRVFGAVGWHNVGRVWEGFQGWYDNAKLKLVGFWLKRLELNDSDGNRDFDVMGVNATVKEIGLEATAFHEYDADNAFRIAGMNNLDRTNLGLYLKRKHQQLDFELNGIYQFGAQATGSGTTATEIDIAAFLVAFEAGYSIPGSGKARVAARIDYTTGDDDPNDDKFKTYQNSYYTGHKFRGYMDYFVPSNTPGLVDFVLRGKASPAPGWLIKGDLHYFTTAADYTDFNDQNTKDVGVELDVIISTKRVAGVGIAGGAAVFLPTESFAGLKNPNPGFWLFSMMTADF